MENIYNLYHWAFKRKAPYRANYSKFRLKAVSLSDISADYNSNYFYSLPSQVESLEFTDSRNHFEDFSYDNLTLRDIKKYEIIKWLLIRKANIKIIESILEQDNASNVVFLKDQSGDTLLHIATRHEHTAAMKYFLSLDADVNCKNFRGDTPLHMTLLCSQAHFPEIIRILVNNGADVNAVDENSNTFAHLCASRLSTEHFKMSVESLINLGYARLFLCRNDLKQTPLHVAILRGLRIDLETLKLMLESSGFNLNDRYTEGDTLLHYTARFGRDQELLEYIVLLGGNWKLVNNYQKTVLHCAVAGCNIEAIEYFISLGADINARDFLGRTPMHHLKFARKDNAAVVRDVLLQFGADKDAIDDCGNKPILKLVQRNLDMNANLILV